VVPVKAFLYLSSTGYTGEIMGSTHESPTIRVVGMFERLHGLAPGTLVVDTTSKAPTSWMRDLSPFHLGPVDLYWGFSARNVENAWQFAKVYKRHTDLRDGDPIASYWEWAELGWSDRRAYRYPMGKGAIPEYSFWAGEKLSYIEARKRIYGPLYAAAVKRTPGYARLRAEASSRPIILRDFDGYDHDKLKHSLSQVLNDSRRKMGHAFVLKMLLTNDEALQGFGV
jgi:hypothetical protein